MINNVITLEHYLILAAIVFTIGIVGLFMNRKNLVTVLMSIELMLLSVNINFVAFSVYLHDLSGQIISVIVLTIAAAETAIGLAIIVLYFRHKLSVQLTDLSKMKG